MKTLIRITTISSSLNILLKGQLSYLNRHNYHVIGVASGNDDLYKIKKREGIETVNITMSRNINIMQDLKSLFVLIFYFYNNKPYIVHANTPKASLLSMIAAWINRVPHRIYTVTGLRFETARGLFRWLLILMEKITCKCATKVIPEGDGVKATLLKERITSKPLTKILNGNINGIDTNYFSRSPDVINEAKIIKSLDSFTFCFVGRMVRDKGVVELVKAFIRLYNDDEEVTLLLVGPFEKETDPLPSEIENLILKHPKIKYVGFQNDVRPYFVASDALVFPSHREGFPNVVLQAGAMELPSIVTDINGCNEIIQKGVNGIIIPPNDEDALFDAMKYFYIQKGTAMKLMSQNARQIIINKYEQHMIWNATLEMYNSLD